MKEVERREPDGERERKKKKQKSKGRLLFSYRPERLNNSPPSTPDTKMHGTGTL